MKTVGRPMHKDGDKSSAKTVDNGAKVAKTAPENSQKNTQMGQNSPFEDRKNLRVLRFFVADDGTVDFSRMQGKTVEDLKNFVRRPEVKKNLNLETAQTGGEKDEGFGTLEANALLDVLCGIEAPVASRLYGVPFDICHEAFQFAPEVRSKINPSMIRLLNKWAPLILKTWKDEVGFALVMGSAVNLQIQTMRLLEKKRKDKVDGATKTVIPIRSAESSNPIPQPPPPVPQSSAPSHAPAVSAQSPSQINLTAKESLNLDAVGFEF
jgi:hypothetical protein